MADENLAVIEDNINIQSMIYTFRGQAGNA